MATETQQWAADQTQTRGVFDMSIGTPHVSAQIEKMERKLENFDSKVDMLMQKITVPVQQVAVQQPTAAVCSICSMPNHDFMGCPHKDAYPEHVAEQVNAFNNFQRLRNDPYSNFYNPGWRDHPNMKWGGNQQVQHFQQNHVQQPVVQPKRSLEDTLQMFMQSTKQYIDKNDQNMQNVQASIQNLEKQFKHYDNHENAKSEDKSVENPTEFVAKPTEPAAAQLAKNNPAIEKCTEHVYEAPIPYPECLKPTAKDKQLRDFMQTLYLPLLDAIKNIPSYAKFLKDVCTHKKKLVDFEKVVLTEQCSAVLQHKLPPKKKDPGSFTISCTIGNSNFKRALIDLGASINLMPYSVFQRLGQGDLRPTSIILQLANCSVTYPKGIIEDLIIKTDNLYLPADFVVLDMDEDL
ncbi:uncharacterized protein LOC125472859 [Pyrus x bretschneideri]|uniref:uncharacterized protein LOC125472859 n=1 Tax=Pyrus x bretschneideri TaxID=225117 RepID=UPI00202F3F6D|nr:uncharacterized protein LOC125472859 [Pyrus x bretschneideri]